jgi:hypothetical protein
VGLERPVFAMQGRESIAPDPDYATACKDAEHEGQSLALHHPFLLDKVVLVTYLLNPAGHRVEIEAP